MSQRGSPNATLSREGTDVHDKGRQPAGYSHSGLRGERAMTQYNTLLGMFHPNGTADGILSVSAQDESTGKTNQIPISKEMAHFVSGLVKSDDLDAKIKFLAAERLRGDGRPVFNTHRDRVANALGMQNYVTGEVWKNNHPFRLALNKATSDEITWRFQHYTGRGATKFTSLVQLWARIWECLSRRCFLEDGPES